MLSYEQDAVETLISRGAPFEEIEAYIDTLPLPSDELSALWLLAWAEATNPATRRWIVAETITKLGSDGTDRRRRPQPRRETPWSG